MQIQNPTAISSSIFLSPILAVSQRLHTGLIALLLCLWLGLVAAPAAHAQNLPDFSALVESVGPSVVNIRTTEKMRAPRGNGGPEFDEDMLEFFKRFGMPIPNQPQNPRRAPPQRSPQPEGESQ